MSSNYDPQRLVDPYIYQGTAGFLEFFEGSLGVEWSQAGNTVVRDIIAYSDFGAAGSTPRCASHPKIEIGWGAERLDNFRWERLNLRNSSGDPTSSILRVDYGLTGFNTPSGGLAHGRLKFYDCQWTAFSYPSSTTQSQGPVRVIQSGPACWDIRHRAGGMPWAPFWSGQERSMYLRRVVGPETYPDLDYNWHPDVPSTGFHAGAFASNIFVNLWDGERLPPMHPLATLNSSTGLYEGPAFTSYAGFYQSTNRPEYTSDSDMSSGILALWRCEGRGQGVSSPGNEGTAFWVYAHNGITYCKDIVVRGHFQNGASGGAIEFLQDFSGNDSWAGPQGRNRPEYETDRTYASKAWYVDGLTIDVADNLGRTMTKAHGVELIKLIKFDFILWAGRTARNSHCTKTPCSRETGTRRRSTHRTSSIPTGTRRRGSPIPAPCRRIRDGTAVRPR